MRTPARKLLSRLLVAVYGSVSLLGYGLHELAPDCGHHHGLAAVDACDHGHAGHEHEPLAAESGGSANDSHDCDVCVFLDQLRSEQPQVHTAQVWHEFVCHVATITLQFNSQTTLGLHVARGPPADLG